MSDYLLQFALGNGLVSALVAMSAWLAQTRLRRPMLAHLLWLLALVKLVTPPLLTVPLLPLPAEPAPLPAAAAPMADYPVDAVTPTPLDAVTTWLPTAGDAALWLWLAGSVVVLLWSGARIARFHRLLTLSSRPAPVALQDLADRLASSLGLRRAPRVWTTSARVSPMVWWLGGRVRVFVPADMEAELGRDQLRWILAHELGHVRRGDHLVRWLEWLACVGFWWNPIAWWARRNLRANEEICCDALVLRAFGGDRSAHSYANSLLRAVEFLATPGLRPPAMASEINSGGFLERRFRMIVQETPPSSTPRWLQAALMLFTTAVLPLGVAYAQDPDVEAVGRRLRAAVQEGELSKEHAKKLLDTLRASAQDPVKTDTAKKDAAKKDAAAKAREKVKRQLEAEKRDLERDMAIVKKKLAAAVEAEHMSAEEARRQLAERLAQAKEQLADRQTVYARKLRDYYQQLKQDPRAGRSDRPDASARREALTRQYLEAARKLEAAVADGKIDAADAKEKLEQARRTIEYVRRDKAAADEGEGARRRKIQAAADAIDRDRASIEERAAALRAKIEAERAKADRGEVERRASSVRRDAESVERRSKLLRDAVERRRVSADRKAEAEDRARSLRSDAAERQRLRDEVAARREAARSKAAAVQAEKDAADRALRAARASSTRRDEVRDRWHDSWTKLTERKADAAATPPVSDKAKQARAHLQELVELGVLTEKQARAKLEAFESKARKATEKRAKADAKKRRGAIR